MCTSTNHIEIIDWLNLVNILDIYSSFEMMGAVTMSCPKEGIL